MIEWSKRPTQGGFGGRVSYTYSVLKDNQIGETNFYTNNGNGVPLNNYNYIASMPACTTTNLRRVLQPAGEYGYGVLDVPHRVIIAPIWQLPFGKDRRWVTKSRLGERARRRLDGVGGHQPAERLPDRLHAERQHAVRRRATGRT